MLNENDLKKSHGGAGLCLRRRGVKLLLGLVCGLNVVWASAQTEVTRTGLYVSVPNGYPNVQVDDMRVMSTAGTARWSRRWSGKEWTFNSHWESLSQSWTNLTGSVTGTSTAGTSASGTVISNTSPPSDSEAGCWVWVDEDWQPSKGTTIVDSQPIGIPMEPQRIAPFNKVMGEDRDDYPAPRIVNIDYASLCRGTATLSSPVRDVEAVRLKNELYLGDNGRYAFSNRTTLEKRAVRGLPAAAAAALDSTLAAGSITLTPVAIAKGFRWMDKGGDWIDYNTQGQVVAYGDRNDNTVWMARDTAGILRGVVDANGRVMFTLHYNGALLTEVRDYPIAGMPLDLPARSVKYGYDAAFRLTSVIDVRGNTTRYSYDVSNHLTSITDQEGRVETIAYAGNSVAKRTAPDGGVTDYSFEFDDVNKQFFSRITGPETAAGRRVEEFTHNRTGQSVRLTVNGRVDDEVRYDTGTRSESHTNARGFNTAFTKNEFDEVVQVNREDGSTLKYAYSVLNLKTTQLIDAAGVRTTFEYDALGNQTRMVEAVGTSEERTTEYVVNGQGRITQITGRGRTEANGTATRDAVKRFSYDALGQLRSVVDAEGNTRQIVYDRTGNAVSLTNANGNTARMEYTPDGMITKITDPMAHSWAYAYDKAGNVIVVTDPLGKIARQVYDAANRLIQSTGPLADVTALQYDAVGATTRVTNGEGNTVKLEYDNFYRLIKHVDAADNIIRFGYELPDGTLGGLVKPTEIVTPTFTEQRRFDRRERSTTSTLVETGRDDRTRSQAHDVRGYQTSATDAYGKIRTTAYDSLGRATAATDALGKRTSYQYDVNGNMIQLTDANGKELRFSYDRMGRLVKEFLPLGQVTSYTYDAVGNVAAKVDFNGNQASFTYDAANRLTHAQEKNALGAVTRTLHITWDDRNQIQSWTDSTGSGSAYVHDDAGRRTSETVTYPGGFSMQYRYGYDLSGRKTRLTWPDGTQIDYRYGLNGQVNGVTIPGEGEISVSQFKWMAPTMVTLPGGTTIGRNYAADMNLRTQTVRSSTQNLLFDLSATYGREDEVKDVSRSDLGGVPATSRYIYDEEFRLTRASTEVDATSTDNETFAFDAVDNRISHSKVVGAWTYDDNYRLIKQGQGAGSTSFAYDDAGNMTRKTDASGSITDFAYDTANRVQEVHIQDHLVARYGYDPSGRRIWKEQFGTRDGTALPQAQRYYYLYGDEGLLAEARQALVLNADGSTTPEGQVVIVTQYGPAPDSPFNTLSMFAKTKDSNNADRYAYFIHDQRGALVQAVDKAGHVVWAAKYDAFGRATIISPAATEEIPTVELSLRLPGQVEDVETGLHYNWQRTYDPSTGRYLERDPAGLSGGINPYQYVSGNPTTLVDPTGEFGIAAPAARLVLGQVARTAAGVAAGAVGGAAVFVGSAVIVAGAAACWVSESCRKWVSNAWYGTTVPAANTPATTGEFCRIPPGYMNEHKDNPTGNGEGTNTGTSTSDPKAPPQPGEIPTLDWNDPTKPPIGPNGEEWVWRGKPPQGGDKGGYVNPSNPDQSAHPDLAHPAPVGPHWDYTDRNKDNPGWRVYPGGKIDKK